MPYKHIICHVYFEDVNGNINYQNSISEEELKSTPLLITPGTILVATDEVIELDDS